MTKPFNLSFRKATPQDESAVIALVNSVYRSKGERQWTTEVGLVEGPRLNSSIYNDITLGRDNFLFLAFSEKKLVACVHLHHFPLDAKCNLGMLSVDGALQQYGIGARILACAEDFIKNELGIDTVVMQVISIRKELINWYKRKGYESTGEMIPFGSLAGSQNYEKEQKLYFEVLKKNLISLNS